MTCARSFFDAGKGLLAADESTTTATKRLGEYGIAASEENRRLYRELFLGAPGVENYLSGVILYEETFGQKANDKKKFPESLALRGIAPGIKVDQGTEPFPESTDEVITKGLIGLPERLADFRKRGALFTKWRAVITIDGTRLPSAMAIHENAKRLGNYAKDAQMANLVPIIEPEVLYDGSHSRLRAKEVLEETICAVFAVLEEQSVDLSAVILKTAMALTGKGCGVIDAPEDVAHDTLDALMKCVPKKIPGIVFLSGGQTPDQATDNLRAIARQAKEREAPWPLTFSYARALQEEALAVWKGDAKNVDAAREVFMGRLKKVSEAQKGN